jgi:hypothetical protein
VRCRGRKGGKQAGEEGNPEKVRQGRVERGA